MVEQGMRAARGQEMELGEALYEVLLQDVHVYIFSFFTCLPRIGQQLKTCKL